MVAEAFIFVLMHVFTFFFKWLFLAVPMGALVGSACALFLWSLDQATRLRFSHPALLYILPLGGLLIAGLYQRWGKSAESGNNLLFDSIHHHAKGDSSVVVPRRMAPLILISTVATHLFGGSAGRESTALQMGGSIASTWGRLLRLNPEDTKSLLMAGIAAGFGGVFGTPMAGVVFAMEVLVVGRLHYGALIPCLMASLASHWACGAWNIHHTPYSIGSSVPSFDLMILVQVLMAAVAFGLASVLFAKLTHSIGWFMKAKVKNALWRPVLGGLVLLALAQILGTRDYLGLGVLGETAQSITLPSSFQAGGATPFSWAWKILFTAITLGCGFKGGEVTPLFFIGASLGNTLALLMGAPVDLFAGLGFIAVFAGATNTPLACTLMGIELFGSEYAVYFMVACFMAYLCSGNNGIYSSQHREFSKHS